jgi:hypothetical protein
MSTSAAITLSSDTRTTTERESDLLPARLALGEQAVNALVGSYYASYVAGGRVPRNWPERAVELVLRGLRSDKD